MVMDKSARRRTSSNVQAFKDSPAQTSLFTSFPARRVQRSQNINKALKKMAPTPTTEQNFRANLSQFRWARGVTDDSQRQHQAQPSNSGGNPFSRFYNAVGGSYIPLRSNERSNEEEAYFALSRWDRSVK